MRHAALVLLLTACGGESLKLDATWVATSGAATGTTGKAKAECGTTSCTVARVDTVDAVIGGLQVRFWPVGSGDDASPAEVWIGAEGEELKLVADRCSGEVERRSGSLDCTASRTDPETLEVTQAAFTAAWRCDAPERAICNDTDADSGI